MRAYHRFDSFEGLADDWAGTDMAKVFFNLVGKQPALSNNVLCAVGGMLDTLEPFLAGNPEEIAFFHIDTNSHAPFYHVLKLFMLKFKVGKIILFDELLGCPNNQSHEFKALKELIPLRNYDFVSYGVADPKSNFVKSTMLIK